MSRAVAFIALLTPLLVRAEDRKRAAPTLEVRLTDGSHINLAVLDETISIQTPHGKLLIPLADVRRIEFGPRLSDEVRKKMEDAIVELGTTELAKREAAGAALLKIGPPAYAAVQKAMKSPNKELAISAKNLREKFVEAFPEQRLIGHDMDVIYTDDAKIAGRIESTAVHVNSPQFGERTLKVSDLVSLRGAAIQTDEKFVAQPDPGNLTNFAQQTGKSFYFTVTGNASGTVYGTDLYTTDSQLATAAVHTGLLRNGETGVIKVTIEPAAASYTSSTRNGVTSYDWQQYHASYKLSRVKDGK